LSWKCLNEFETRRLRGDPPFAGNGAADYAFGSNPPYALFQVENVRVLEPLRL
jgi:hypothetical protein